MTDEAKALLFVAVLLFGIGFISGRVTAPAVPPEVQVVEVPVEPQAPCIEPEPKAVETVPLPEPRPKVDEAPMQTKPRKATIRKPRAESRQRRPTAYECSQMSKVSRETAKALTSYTSDEIERAYRDCGL